MDLRTKQLLFPYAELNDWFYMWVGVSLLRGTDWVFNYNSVLYSSLRDKMLFIL